MTPLQRYVYQPIADRVMDRWHRSCYWLAGQCAVGVVAAWLGSAVAQQIATPEINWVGWGFLPCLAFVMWIDWQRAVAEDKKFWSGRPVIKFPLPASLMWGLQGMWLTYLAFILGTCWLDTGLWHIVKTVCYMGYGLAWLSESSFMECIPKPPARQTAKEPRFAKPLAVVLARSISSP